MDIQPIIEQLQAGNFVGDRLAKTGYTVFKVRVRNSDIQKGKSAGYRLIYQLSSPTSFILLLIYSKLEQTDITAEEIRSAITKFKEDNVATEKGMSEVERREFGDYIENIKRSENREGDVILLESELLDLAEEYLDR